MKLTGKISMPTDIIYEQQIPNTFCLIMIRVIDETKDQGILLVLDISHTHTDTHT